MTFDIEAGGERRRVAVRRAEQGWVVTLDGRELAADLVSAGGGWSLLLRASRPSGPGEPEPPSRSYEIAIAAAGDELHVHVNGVVVPVRIADPRRAWSRAGHDHGSGGAGPQPIAAPMPGRVVKLLVKPGDAVTARQGLVVVEAMKMENELRSPKDGVVAEVRASEGMSVEAGAVLVVIE